MARTGTVLVDKSQSNCTDATIQKFAREILGLKERKDQAASEYQSAWKRAKAAGVKPDPLKAALKAKERDPDDVVADQRAYIRYCALLNIPLTQADLFEGAPDAEEAPSQDEADEHARFDANRDGVAAGRAGQSRDANPARPGELRFAAWDAGWLSGQQAIAEEMAQPAPVVKKASTRRARNGGVALAH